MMIMMSSIITASENDTDNRIHTRAVPIQFGNISNVVQCCSVRRLNSCTQDMKVSGAYPITKSARHAHAALIKY